MILFFEDIFIHVCIRNAIKEMSTTKDGSRIEVGGKKSLRYGVWGHVCSVQSPNGNPGAKPWEAPDHEFYRFLRVKMKTSYLDFHDFLLPIILKLFTIFKGLGSFK